MLKDYKRLNLSALAKGLPIDYQALQYFLADAHWNYESLNATRINLLRKQRTTGFSKDGVLAIDDTGSLKPYAKKTEGVSYQYCPVIKDKAYCNVAVVSCYANAAKHIPLNLRFYRSDFVAQTSKTEAEFICGKNNPDFKSKLDFAMELIEEAIAAGIAFSHIVFDSWYASCDMIDFIDELGKKFISEVKSDRRLLVDHPVSKKKVWLRADELVKLIKKHLWHKTRMVNYGGRLIPAYTLNVRVKDSQVELKAFCIMGKWSPEDDKSCHILITNNLSLDHPAKGGAPYTPCAGVLSMPFKNSKTHSTLTITKSGTKRRLCLPVRSARRQALLDALSFSLDAYLLDKTKCLSVRLRRPDEFAQGYFL